jgi:hypothetical protein
LPLNGITWEPVALYLAGLVFGVGPGDGTEKSNVGPPKIG